MKLIWCVVFAGVVFTMRGVRCSDETQTSGSDEDFEKKVLKAMKDEGLLDEWKKKLDTMIFDENAKTNEVDDGQAEKFTAGLKCAKDKASGQPEEQSDEKPVPKTINEVEDALKQLLGTDDELKPETIQKNPEMVGELERLVKAAQGLLKTEEPKVSEQKTKKPTKPKQQKPKKKKTQGLESLMGPLKELVGHDEHNPTLDIMMNMASAYFQNSGSQKSKSEDSGMDWGSLLQMAQMFSGGGNSNSNIFDLLGNLNLDMGQVMNIAGSLMGQPQKKSGKSDSLTETIISAVASFFDMDSEVISKYYNAISSLALANNWNQVSGVFRELTGSNLDDLVDVVDDKEFQDELAESVTSKFVSWVQEFLEPSSLRTKLFFVNGFLMKNGYGIIDANNLIKTTSKVVDKAAKDLLGYESVDSESYMKNIEKRVKGLLRVGENEKLDLQNFPKEQLAGIGKAVALKEVVEPFTQVIADFKIAAENPRCAEFVLCRANMPAAVQTSLGLRAAVSRASCTFAAWALTRVNKPGMPSFTQLYQAAWDGSTGEDCMLKYPKCTNLLGSSKTLLQPDYLRTEL